MERIHKPTQTDVDLFRDTPLRLLGYANELGESFRGQVPLSAVRFSYVISFGSQNSISNLALTSRIWLGRCHLKGCLSSPPP